jgi:hypothetical protein
MNRDRAPATATKRRTPQRALARSNETSPCLSGAKSGAAKERTAKASTGLLPFQLGDPDVRAALRSHLTRQLCHGDTVLIEELGLCRGQVRADVALVNGSLHAYEIKSDRDTLDRLLQQASMYNKIFNRVTLVVGPRHQSAALALIPAWWGVLGVAPTPRGARLQTVRKGLANKAVDPRTLVELLWLDEALALLESRRAVRGTRGKRRELVWDRVCEHFDVTEIAAAVRDRLKARAAQRAAPSPS